MRDCYSSSVDYIQDIVWYYQLIVHKKIIEFRFEDDQKGDDISRFFSRDIISDKQIDGLLDGERKLERILNTNKQYCSLDKSLTRQEKEISEKTDGALYKGINLPLTQLINNFGLTDFEIDILCMCLLPEIDILYEKVFAYLQDDVKKTLPTINFLITTFFSDFADKIAARKYFTGRSTLFKYNIVRIIDDEHDNTKLLNKKLQLNRRIVDYLLHNCDNPGHTLCDYVTVVKYRPDVNYQFFLPDTVKTRFDELPGVGENHESGYAFVFYGPDEMHKEKAALWYSISRKKSLLMIDLAKIVKSKRSLRSVLRALSCECRLFSYIPYFKHAHVIFEREYDDYRQIVHDFFADMTDDFFIGYTGNDTIANLLSGKKTVELFFAMPTFNQRLSLWKKFLEECGGSYEHIDITDIANKFKFTGDQIKNSVVIAHNKALSRSGDKQRLSLTDLYNACQKLSHTNLNKLSRKITCRYGWDDIVLPADMMTLLEEILTFVKYNHVVFDTWGFNKKMSYGRGLTCLFSGVSGTGKTMAAEVLAHELELDLYKVDLSTIVSKYIGETEKNLNRIFTEAQSSNAIIFFDEADALFGKRSQVKDAHDRYANIETGYLLQKMEEYEGIIILATNLKNNMDEAFTRRIQFSIDFPFPEKADRQRIWQKIFPAETPLDPGIDYDFLSGNFLFTGGNIKNIALTASFYAAREERPVTMQDIINACKREFQKMGRVCTRNDFGEYYDLLPN